MKPVVFANALIVIRSLIFINFCGVSVADSKYFLDKVQIDHHTRNEVLSDEDDSTSAFWKSSAQNTLRNQLMRRINNNTARNVIFFMGDGMSISTVTAARIYKGQLRGRPGEEEQLSFDRFPYTGLSKTYCIDSQIADSACAATALFSGINGNFLTGGVNGKVLQNDCEAALIEANQVDTIFTWAHQAGKGSGIVTNTRVTHATPAVAYSHSSNRNFECDSDVFKIKAAVNASECRDIARQMVLDKPGKDLKVIFGGGRLKFLPKQEIDEDGKHGERSDGLNLISQWKEEHKHGAYVTNKSELENVDFNTTEQILGLFSSDHMSFSLDADPNKEPSLKEMTEAAIKLLKKDSNGFVLFVEGGRIDHAHHEAWARKALDETVQFSDAIQAAVDLTNEEDTLIVVTSDHSHTLSISGYAKRGNDVLGTVTINRSEDQLPYTTLSYANGPGGKLNANADGSRKDLKGKVLDKSYRYTGAVPIIETTHAGEDVGVFARGPQSHLFTGSYHQNAIPDMIAYAACIGDGLTKCNEH